MLTLLLVALLQTPQASELKERYECHGVTPRAEYDVSLEVAQKGENFYLLWHRPQGIQARGLGFIEEGRLVAVFVTDKDEVGVASYRITKGGLEGTWISGNGMKFSENCAFGKTSGA